MGQARGGLEPGSPPPRDATDSAGPFLTKVVFTETSNNTKLSFYFQQQLLLVIHIFMKLIIPAIALDPY